MGMYNLLGQFGGMFNNYQTNMYNRQMQDYYAQQAAQQNQYQHDLDYWNQMNKYDQGLQGYNQWHTGATRMAPIAPREKPMSPSWIPQPGKPAHLDFSGLMGGFGGQNSWSATPPPGTVGGGFNYGAYNGPKYQAPAAWNNPGIDTANMVDPSAVIASAQPGIMENMNRAFAEAGNRFGSSGMVGTPYADALGGAARGAANDIANITNQYQFAASQQAAELEQARQLAEYQANFNAWAQQGDWAHQGQLADMGQGYDAWAQMGDWQYGNAQNQSQLANQQWMAQNNWNFQDYQQQQQQMQQLMPLFMQMMMGMGG